jgi:ABC-type lipoprotein export system ATPase subunit/GNAT superfamily N-acetyltransferase
MNSSIFEASVVLGKGKLFEVSSVAWRDHLKRLTLRPGPIWLTVPRSACVSTGDQVQLCDATAWVICHNGRAQILQPYTARETLALGGLRIEMLVKEITELGEHEAYSSLAEYHYREHSIHGRTARLIVRAFHPLFPQVLGYIELATPFYMNKARATILNAPFQSGSITWETWDKPTMQRYIHLIVRIARCVVYPEFRGVGLGQILLKHAAEFARQRWQVAGFLPFFLEILADMLKYVPFAEKAGMAFIGETEGNLKRVAKDMEYLIRNAKRVKAGEIVSEEACGIVDQQVARMNRALALMEREGWSRERLVERLRTLSHETILRDFALFHDIISLPKPTYMQGLNPDAELFLACRVAEVAPRNGHVPRLLQVDRLDGPVVLCDVTLTFRSQVRRTQQTHMVQQAFGISPEAIETTVVRRLSLAIQPGSVLLIIGPSGSGKTTLLDLLAAGATHQQAAVRMSGDIRWPANYRPGVFQTIRSHRALIEVLGGHDVRATLDLMGLVGLSDAFIYLKRFHELSKGQQYRALLVRLIAGGYNIWLVDEFCANLDPVTAGVVADKLQRTARRLGVTVVVAAPHCEHFLWALRPDTVLQMTSAWEYQVVEGKTFMRSMLRHSLSDGSLPQMRLRPEFFRAVLNGEKRITIRKGRKQVQAGLLLFESESETLAVHVTDVTMKRFRGLTVEDAHAEGLPSIEALRKILHSFYPDLRDHQYVTVVAFQLPCDTQVS